MKLEHTFAQEVKKISNGDGSKDAQWAFRSKLLLVQKRLSTTAVRTKFDRCIMDYGRVPVAICVAITIIDRRDRLEDSSCQWAFEVLKLWKNRPNMPLRDFWFAKIDDGLHPTRIEEYAGGLMRLTTDEW